MPFLEAPANSRQHSPDHQRGLLPPHWVRDTLRLWRVFPQRLHLSRSLCLTGPAGDTSSAANFAARSSHFPSFGRSAAVGPKRPVRELAVYRALLQAASPRLLNRPEDTIEMPCPFLGLWAPTSGLMGKASPARSLAPLKAKMLRAFALSQVLRPLPRPF